MKNGDLPINPTYQDRFDQYGEKIIRDCTSEGLTKREYFAAIAMQGILSSCFASMNPQYQHAAEDAIGFADALLEELDKPKP